MEMKKSLKEIADALKGRLIGDGSIQIKGINSLSEAKSGDISFYYDPRFRDALKDTKASALIVKEQVQEFSGPQLIVRDPIKAYIKLCSLFFKEFARPIGISPEAYIEEDCKIGDGVSIYPFVYIGKGSEIGNGVRIYPGTFIGDRVRIGDDTLIYSNVSIMDGCIVGKRVIIHAGCTIGSDGFGYIREGGGNIKIPQKGIVLIEDDVEIGANCSIDRATFGRTWIKRGVKMDNLVQIGHNVIIGEDSLVVAQTGISGSVSIGRDVIIGGQVGIADHISIGDRVKIASKSGIAKSIENDRIVSGIPAIPHQRWLRCSTLFERLPDIQRSVRNLEREIDELKEMVHKRSN